MTQEALAERARMSKRGLQDLERGVSQRPRRDTIDLLAVALDLSASHRTEFLAAAQARPIATPESAVSFALSGLSNGVHGPVVGRERELALLASLPRGSERFVGAGAGAAVGR
jgi:transcriptional regulator with XRE-family HTH domain